MPIIEVGNLVKTYKIIEKENGLMGYFKNLIKPKYKEFKAVRGINFSIEEGELIGTTGFYTNSIWGMQILRKSVIKIFSGIIAPITLFPMWFQNLSKILPFKELIYTPINIWLGQVSYNEIFFIIIKQIIWGIILYILAKLFFEHAIKKITINGG